MLFIAILIVKLGLFWFPYHFSQLAYADHMALKSYQIPQSVHEYNLFINNQFNHLVTVDTPKYMVAGNTYPITYTLIWGTIPADGLSFQLTSSPTVSGLNKKIMFGNPNQVIETTITLPSAIEGSEPFKISFSGTLKADDHKMTSLLSTNDEIWIIPNEVKDNLESNRLKNGLAAAISFVIVAAIFLLLW